MLVLVAARGAGVFVCWVWVVCVSRMVVRALAVWGFNISKAPGVGGFGLLVECVDVVAPAAWCPVGGLVAFAALVGEDVAEWGGLEGYVGFVLAGFGHVCSWCGVWFSRYWRRC